ALIKVAFSGICGSELSGFEGQNSLRKPPLIFGHEFSGTLVALGDSARQSRPDLREGQRVTANPLITCGACRYCTSGRNQLCPQRRLLSAHLPGSNAEYVAVRADAVIAIPDELALEQAALAEPTACTIHAARLANATADDTALVIGAGPIGLLMIQALRARGVETIWVADLNAERLAMAEALGAKPMPSGDDALRGAVDLAVDAVGLAATRQTCLTATVPGGRVVWIGLHESHSALDINDMARRELTTIGSFAYAPQDFRRSEEHTSELQS